MVTLATVVFVGLGLSSAVSEAVFGDARSVVVAATQFSSGAVILLFILSVLYLHGSRAGTDSGTRALAAVIALWTVGSLDLVGAAGDWPQAGIEGFVDSSAAAARISAILVLGVYLARWREAEPTVRRLAAICVGSFGLGTMVIAIGPAIGRTPGGVEIGGVDYVSGLAMACILLALGLLSIHLGQANDRTSELWIGVLAIAVATSDIVLHHTTAPTDVGFLGGLGILLAGAGLVVAGFQSDLGRLQTARNERLLRSEIQAETGRQALAAERHERAVVAHDSRSALLAIEGGIRYIAGNPTADPVATAEIHRALTEELGRLRRMLSDREVGGCERFVLAEAIAPAVRLHAIEHRSITVDVPATAQAHGDPDATREIVQNLLDNAVQHGGETDISLRVTEWVDSVTITVTDDGPGVPRALHEVIFERGVSSKPDHSAGLGLHSSRELANKMGGSLRIDPAGRGASFTLTLPVEGAHHPVAETNDHTDAVIDLRQVTAR